jgi:hypothetical protein
LYGLKPGDADGAGLEVPAEGSGLADRGGVVEGLTGGAACGR